MNVKPTYLWKSSAHFIILLLEWEHHLHLPVPRLCQLTFLLLSSIYANIFYVSIRLLLDFDLYENIFDAFI